MKRIKPENIRSLQIVQKPDGRYLRLGLAKSQSLPARIAGSIGRGRRKAKETGEKSTGDFRQALSTKTGKALLALVIGMTAGTGYAFIRYWFGI